MQDLATQWIQSYPCKTKTSQEAQRSLQKFLEPDRNPKVIYTDNSLEFGKACEDLSWNHCTCTPHRSETNGIVERAVRRVKEGTSAVLLQSGLDENWWADSKKCYTYLRNIQDLLSDGKTTYERRFGEPFTGPIIPFGSLVEYYPVCAKDQSRIHQFGKKVLPGLFLGYALHAWWIWKGDIMVADIEELETMDASEIYFKRLNAKEVIFPQENGKFIFPVADGRMKFVGGVQELRTSTLIRYHPIRGEDQGDFVGESEGSPPPLRQDSLREADEARNDFWSISGNIIPPSRWTQSQTLLAERGIIPYSTEIHWRLQKLLIQTWMLSKNAVSMVTGTSMGQEICLILGQVSLRSLLSEESFPVPLKYIDVSRTTHTNLDALQERRIDDYWNIDESRDLSDSWTGFTESTLLSEKPPEGYMWSMWRLTERQATSRPDHLWQSSGRNWEEILSWRGGKSGHMKKPKLDNARKLRWIYFIDSEDKEFKETINNARKKLEKPMVPALPCIDECWNIEGNRDLSDSWTGFTRYSAYWKRNLQMGFHRPGDGWRRNKRHPGLTTLGQRHGKTCQKQRNEKKNKVGYRKTEAWQR